jgi:hypothetical protein
MSKSPQSFSPGDALAGVNRSYGIDTKTFNTEFDRMMELQDNLVKYREDSRLRAINDQSSQKSMAVTDLTIGELAGDMSSQFEGLAIDLLHGRFNIESFGQRRLFYVGLFIISIGVLVWILDTGLGD